jgi:uroporphyrinogen decarboxylase
MEKSLLREVRKAYASGERLTCPLMGFPGLQLVDSNIKLAQQNYGEHYKVLESLVKKFDPDVIFPLMDLSVEANALGMYTVFPQQDSATVLREDVNIAERLMKSKINICHDSRLQGYVETVRLSRLCFPEHIVKGAYVTGPYTLAGLIIGAENAAIAAVMEPEKLLKLCEYTIERILEYIRLLTGAGAQMICVLEPSAVMLGPDEFKRFSADFINHIHNNYKYTDISTVYHTCGNTMHIIREMSESGVDALSLDSCEMGVNLPEVARMLNNDCILIGNISPTGSILTGKPEDVRKEVFLLLESMDFYENFILSTGCDLPQEVPAENIEAFMKAGREYRIKSKTIKSP